MADLSVVENGGEQRYELRNDAGEVLGYLEYMQGDDFIVLPHTEVDRSLRGQGWGDRLVRFALDDLRAKGAKAYPTCPFVDRWMQRHDEYEDLRYVPQ
ncbi:GNAT family N-acetyltransferase [Glycomyces sp. NPDC047369]